VQPNVWAKIDVELDDDDLRRLLHAAGITDVHPADVATEVAFQLLDSEAERFVLAKLMTSYGLPENTGRPRLVQLQETKDRALNRVRAGVAT
jgi:hypothetical protein